MRTIIKHLLLMSLLLVGIAVYFLKTDKGHLTLGVLIEDYLSTHTYNKIKVLSFNLEKYPHIVLELQLNNTANILLEGKLSKYHIDMNYHLRGEELHFNDFHLKDKIDVTGKLKGAFSSLEVTGEGEIFEGEVAYSFTNVPHAIKEMNMKMRRVNIKKIFTFLEEKSILMGLANIDAHFGSFSKYAKEGQAEVYMQSASFSQIKEYLPFVLNATMDFQGVEYLYRADMDADIGRAIFRNGHYHDGKQIATGEYKLYLKDIADLKKLLNHNYQGALETSGTVTYDTSSKLMEIRGQMGQFGGEISYLYKDDYLDMRLKKVSLKRILEQLSYPLFFVSNIDGRIEFNLKDKRVIINTELRDTHFVASRLSKMVYEKASIDILSEVYDKSSFSGGYQNSVLSSTLKIDNGKNHIYLTDTTLNVDSGKMDSKFEIKMQGEELLGEIHGTIDEAKVWIDKERFMEYQTDKYLSDWFGTMK